MAKFQVRKGYGFTMPNNDVVESPTEIDSAVTPIKGQVHVLAPMDEEAEHIRAVLMGDARADVQAKKPEEKLRVEVKVTQHQDEEEKRKKKKKEDEDNKKHVSEPPTNKAILETRATREK